MKKIALLLALVPITLMIMAFKGKTTVQFMSTDWDTAKNKAFSEGKLYFVDFDASYCATCRNMDQSTYMSSQLANYMEKNVVALRVDVQDFDGVMWSQQYEVEALPTMLVFNEEGKLVKKIVGYQSANDLMDVFSSSKTTTPLNSAAQPISSDTPMPSPDVVVKTNTTANVNTTPTVKTKDLDPVFAPANNSTSFMEDAVVAPQPRGKGLYEISVTKQASADYGVQVGVFSDYKLIMEQAALFKKKYSKQKTIVHIDTHNGSTVYKLILGTFKDKRIASNFRNMLRKDKVDGLIKDLSYLG